MAQTPFAVFALESVGACKTWGLLGGSYKLKCAFRGDYGTLDILVSFFPGISEVSDAPLPNKRHAPAMVCCLGVSPEQQGNQHGTETSQTMIQSKPFLYS